MWLRRCTPLLARVFDMPWSPGSPGRPDAEASSEYTAERDGFLEYGPTTTRAHFKTRKALHQFLTNDAEEPDRKFTNLPGVYSESDLPADPLTRLFFQAKGDRALYQGTYDDPAVADGDRVELATRHKSRVLNKPRLTPIADFCHRIREAQEKRKRFVIVPATHDTRGGAEVLYNNGLITGFRDFHNDRGFAVELKYFQGEPTINNIEAVAKVSECEFEFSPRMMRAVSRSAGKQNKVRIYCVRTWDGRIIDNFQAQKEGIGGRGLFVAF